MGQLLPALCLMAFLIDYFPCVRLCFNIINCFHCDFWFVIESKTLCDITHLFPCPSLSENYSQADKVRKPCHCGEALLINVARRDEDLRELSSQLTAHLGLRRRRWHRAQSRNWHSHTENHLYTETGRRPGQTLQSETQNYSHSGYTYLNNS